MIIPLKFKLAPLVDIVNNIEFRPYPKDNPTHQCWPNWDNDYGWPEKHQELYEYIEKNTYPHDVPIAHFWFKRYEAGEWSGLHQEKFLPWIEEDNKKWWTTIILVERSNDLVGGETVIAGDSIEGIRDKLVVSHLEEIGDSMSWNSETFHGLAEVTQGRRTVLVINKPEKI